MVALMWMAAKNVAGHLAHLPWREREGCGWCEVRNEIRTEREIRRTMDMLAITLGDELYLRRRFPEHYRRLDEDRERWSIQ